MKTAFKVGLSALAAAVLFTAPGHALLVNYEFEGIVETTGGLTGVSEGAPMAGSISFNTSDATPADPTVAPGSFFFPASINLEVGPYSFTGDQAGPSTLFSEDGFRWSNVPVSDGPTSGDLGFAVGGNGLFADAPVDSLEGGNWDRVNAAGPNSGWAIDTFQNDEFGRVDGQFTRFEFVDVGDPVAPIPEPATMIIFGTGLAGAFGAGLRKKKEKKS